MVRRRSTVRFRNGAQIDGIIRKDSNVPCGPVGPNGMPGARRGSSRTDDRPAAEPARRARDGGWRPPEQPVVPASSQALSVSAAACTACTARSSLLRADDIHDAEPARRVQERDLGNPAITADPAGRRVSSRRSAPAACAASPASAQDNYPHELQDLVPGSSADPAGLTVRAEQAPSEPVKGTRGPNSRPAVADTGDEVPIRRKVGVVCLLVGTARRRCMCRSDGVQHSPGVHQRIVRLERVASRLNSWSSESGRHYRLGRDPGRLSPATEPERSPFSSDPSATRYSCPPGWHSLQV
jgi:hypothetical protein